MSEQKTRVEPALMKPQPLPLDASLQNPRGRIAAALLAIGLVAVVAQIGGHAAPPPPTPHTLPYANSYLTTGNYATGFIDLPGTGVVGGKSTGIIT